MPELTNAMVNFEYLRGYKLPAYTLSLLFYRSERPHRYCPRHVDFCPSLSGLEGIKNVSLLRTSGTPSFGQSYSWLCVASSGRLQKGATKL